MQKLVFPTPLPLRATLLAARTGDRLVLLDPPRSQNPLSLANRMLQFIAQLPLAGAPRLSIDSALADGALVVCLPHTNASSAIDNMRPYVLVWHNDRYRYCDAEQYLIGHSSFALRTLHYTTNMSEQHEHRKRQALYKSLMHVIEGVNTSGSAPTAQSADVIARYLLTRVGVVDRSESSASREILASQYVYVDALMGRA